MSANQSFASGFPGDIDENFAKENTPHATMVQPVQESLFSAGMVMAYAGRTPPIGWLLCNGQVVNSADYPNLYASIGRDFVPQELAHLLDENTFCVPDLIGRTIVGVDSTARRVTSNGTLGASGGEERHQLTIDEIPSHQHAQHGRSGSLNSDSKGNPIPNGGDFPSGLTGGDQSHNNMQPYLVLNQIIKF